MTGSGMPKFEIPTGMRKMTEQSLEQVKTAINVYLRFCKSNVPENAMGGSALSDKILGYAERNVASAFEFAQRRAQMQAMAEQTKDLGETTTKALAESMKTPPNGGLSS